MVSIHKLIYLIEHRIFMLTRKDSGVSPVIAVILLIALSVILISIISASVMSGISTLSAVDTKIVGFTVVVNDNNTSTVTPVSGKGLPYLTSYTVYLDNGHVQNVPDSGASVLSGAIITGFDSNVTRINIAGHFTDGITALVFSGKVINKTVVYDPSGGGAYYIMGDNDGKGFTTPEEFVASLNAWSAGLNTTYDYGNGHSGTDIAYLNPYGGNQLNLRGDIVVGREPITITDNLEFLVLNTGNGGLPVITISRAPNYEGSLLVIQSGADVSWASGTNLILDGMGHGEAPLLVIEDNASFAVHSITIVNNTNPNGNGGGIYNAGKFTASSTVTVSGNTAKNGAGLYNLGTISFSSNNIIRDNIASENGGGIYNAAPSSVTIKGPVTHNTAKYGGGIYNVGTLSTVETISENTATISGGGVYNTGTYTFSWTSDVTSNEAQYGGGIYNAGIVPFYGGSISGNAATIQGGGLYNTNSFTLGGGSSITGNTAPLDPNRYG